MAIEALVTLKSENVPAVGRERLKLLEAVAREGSISAGARAIGITYKAAWDGLDAMANLFGKPLLVSRAGGRAGGGATLTPAGHTVIEAFRRMEAEMVRVLRTVEPELAEAGVSPLDLVSGFLMKTSARNAIRGSIVKIVSDALSAEVEISVSPETTIFSLVTHASMEELGLCPGRSVTLLIKAPFVAIATGKTAPKTSARNCIRGIISRCEASDVNAEIILDIGDAAHVIIAIN